MQIIRNTTEFNLKNSCVTLGKFDGVHKGHQKLINTLKENKPIIQYDLDELYTSVKGKNNTIFDLNDKIANAVTKGYKKVEESVVKGYKAVEKGAVDGFNKVSDKCIEKIFAKEGESVEDAKKRLSREDSTEKQTESDNEN